MAKVTELLSPRDVDIIGKCLHATVNGRFFPEWEFKILFGLPREEVRTVHEAWPRRVIAADVFLDAVHGSVLHLWGYPHHMADELRRYWSVNVEDLEGVLDRLAVLESALHDLD